MTAQTVLNDIVDWITRGTQIELLSGHFFPLDSGGEIIRLANGYGRTHAESASTVGNLSVIDGALTNALEVLFPDMIDEPVHSVGIGSTTDLDLVLDLATPITPERAGHLVLPAEYIQFTFDGTSGVTVSDYARETSLGLLIDELEVPFDYPAANPFPAGWERYMGLLDNGGTELSGNGYQRVLIAAQQYSVFGEHVSGQTDLQGLASIRFMGLSEEGLPADTVGFVAIYDSVGNELVRIAVNPTQTLNNLDKLWFQSVPTGDIIIESSIT